ncbi:unnamed protein product [Lathyrus sativus]|nr:unnamed protein product [Lathyrus sativus]
MHYFDLIRLKSEQEHLFRNIQRNEYHNLYGFISSKGLKIMNLGDALPAAGVAKAFESDDDDAVDPHLERIRNEAGENESDEEVPNLYLIHFLSSSFVHEKHLLNLCSILSTQGQY